MKATKKELAILLLGIIACISGFYLMAINALDASTLSNFIPSAFSFYAGVGGALAGAGILGVVFTVQAIIKEA
jgi:hypothetical protein